MTTWAGRWTWHSGAMDVAQQALETAQTAETNAQTALDTANSFSSAIQSAQQDASTALSTAQTAQTTASNANNTAIQAQQDASSAVTTANNASRQVSTLSGTVTALGQRVTTAEGNISQNTNDITALTTRVGTAEIAQGNASSAMATAGQVKQQAFVFRYSSTVLVASSTNSNALLDNTDNLKVGDKVIDSSGVLFSVTAIDTANSTFTVGTALIDLAQDSDVVHKSGDETVGGIKNFTNDTYITSLNFTNEVASPSSSASSTMPIINTITYTSGDTSVVARLNFRVTADGIKSLYPHENNQYALGLTSRKWSEIHGVTYYYGSSDTEFSTKFVTTDTAQTISGSKTFSSDLTVANTDTTANTPNLNLRNYKVDKGTTDTGVQIIQFLDKNAKALTLLESRRYSSGNTATNILCYNNDDNNNTVSGGVTIVKGKAYTNFAPSTDNAVTCGRPLAKWSDVQTYKVNALEPSSLSLPSGKNTRIDISSYFTNLGNGDTNSYSVSANGYIYMQLKDIATVHCFNSESSSTTVADYIQTFSRGNDGQLYVLFPVKKDHVFKSTWYTNTTVTITGAYFIPCQGNV